MTRRLLDLFCAGGGAGMGYHRAGFDVVGVDINPQPHYPFAFIQGDALDILRRMLNGEKFLASDGREYGIDDFDAIHASPPCQGYSAMLNIHKNRDAHPDLIAQTRDALNAIGKPYIIENVEGAPLRIDLMLCGTMFGMKIIRHRIFESNVLMPAMTMACNHSDVYDPWHGKNRTADKFREAIGIDWLPLAGGKNKAGSIDLAIPPAYTEFIGKRLMEYLDATPPPPIVGVPDAPARTHAEPHARENE